MVRPDGSNSRVNSRLADAGARAGINFTGLTDRVPNTLAAHVALDFARELDLRGSREGPDKRIAATQNELAERLFKAYFTDGVFLSSENIGKIAAEVPGLSFDEVCEAMADGERIARVKAESARYSGIVRGVPLFVMNGRPAFSGAQPVDRFLAAFERLGATL